ncbi:MAG: L,D-transpeptidase family protein [Alphaproteobacteria bacterium]|nr:L,D-transpeptidase family protein [Alphaproteobacteria bacterium]
MSKTNKFILGSTIIATSLIISHAAYAAGDANTPATPQAVTAVTAIVGTQPQDIKTKKAQAEAEKIAAQKFAQARALTIALKAVELAKIEAAKAADKTQALINPLGAATSVQPNFMAYADFPKIAFNPIKPNKNPLTVYKLRNIVHTLPALDGLTRQNLKKLAKSASVINGVKIWKAERKTLERKLILNNYKSFWFTDSVLDISKAQEIVATVENAENFGLRPARYKLAELKQLIAAASTKIDPAWMQIPGSTEKLKQLAEDQALSQLALNHAKLEIALSHVAFAYSRHASAGQTIPSSVDRNNDVHPEATPATIILSNIKMLSKKGELQNWLEAQNPQSPQFKALLAEFKKQSNISPEDIEQAITVSAGRSLKAGIKSKRVIKLAMRLEQLGFYKKTTDATYPEVANDDIIASVKAYQQDNDLFVDGIAGVNTLNAMNYQKPNYLKTLLVNLERQRWMPHDRGYKHVLVNQAEFRVRVYEDTKITHSARVVIGKNQHQTPIFYNKIRTVVVNPYWNIPASIIYNEMRNKINTDPTYLARNNYQVSGNINWSKANRRYVPFSIRQKPGASNALGRVKFLFPNRHAIYMHDTPSKSLFARDSRAFSHGCVRVQNPELLALNLMGWSQEKYDGLISAGKNRHFALKTKIPVYMTYMTANMNEEGEISYFRDIYNRDAAVARALGVEDILLRIAEKHKTSSIETVVISSK